MQSQLQYFTTTKTCDKIQIMTQCTNNKKYNNTNNKKYNNLLTINYACHNKNVDNQLTKLKLTRHRASTSMYSLTFRVCVTTLPQ